jgi:hypothetical protein
LDARVEDAAQHTHTLEHLERAGLYSNGLRMLRGIEQRVDDPAFDAAAGQFDGGGQPDGPRPRDEHLGVDHDVEIMLPPWASRLQLAAP